MQNSEFRVKAKQEDGLLRLYLAIKKYLSLRAKRGSLKRERANTGLPRLLVKSRSDGKKCHCRIKSDNDMNFFGALRGCVV